MKLLHRVKSGFFCSIRALVRFISSVCVWFIVVVVLYAAIEWCDSSRSFCSNFVWWEKFYAAASNFLIGFIISFFFYFLVVHLPEQRRRAVIKSNFNKMYLRIKQDILYQIIFASRKSGIQGVSTDHETVVRLMTIDGFKAVFSGGRESNEGWYAFANGVEKDGIEFKEILSSLHLLSRQIDFTLHNYIIFDDETFSFLKNLEAVIYQVEKLQPAYVDTKILCSFLWRMFTGWDPVHGYLGYDPIEKIIKRI